MHVRVCIHTVYGRRAVVYVLSALNTSKPIRNQMTTVKTPKTLIRCALNAYVCKCKSGRATITVTGHTLSETTALTLLERVWCVHTGHA